MKTKKKTVKKSAPRQKSCSGETRALDSIARIIGGGREATLYSRRAAVFAQLLSIKGSTMSHESLAEEAIKVVAILETGKKPETVTQKPA